MHICLAKGDKLFPVADQKKEKITERRKADRSGKTKLPHTPQLDPPLISSWNL